MQFLKIMLIIFCINSLVSCSKLKELTDTDLTANATTTLTKQPIPNDYDALELTLSKLNYAISATAHQQGSEHAIQFVDEKSKKNTKQMVNEMYSAFPLLNQNELDQFIKNTHTLDNKSLDSDIANQLKAVDFSKDIIIVVAKARTSAYAIMSQIGRSEDSTPQSAYIYSNVKRIGDMSKDLHIDITFSYLGSTEGLMNTHMFNPTWDTEFYIISKEGKDKLFITFAEKNLHDEYTL